MGKFMTPEQKQQIIDLYKSGVGYATIANKMKLKSNWIKKVLQEAGILRTRQESFDLRLKNYGFNKGINE
jgi:DNA invertase Pin-like site-specific DNA recombinase